MNASQSRLTRSRCHVAACMHLYLYRRGSLVLWQHLREQHMRLRLIDQQQVLQSHGRCRCSVTAGEQARFQGHEDPTTSAAPGRVSSQENCRRTGLLTLCRHSLTEPEYRAKPCCAARSWPARHEPIAIRSSLGPEQRYAVHHGRCKLTLRCEDASLSYHPNPSLPQLPTSSNLAVTCLLRTKRIADFFRLPVCLHRLEGDSD